MRRTCWIRLSRLRGSGTTQTTPRAPSLPESRSSCSIPNQSPVQHQNRQKFWRRGFLNTVPLALVGTGVGATVLAFSATSEAKTDGGTAALAEWVDEFASRPGIKRAGSPGQMLANNPVSKFLQDKDHMFEEMMRVDMVRGIECFYDAQATEFHAAIKLGRNVCGYPSTVHGGLTAAIIDETLGGLMVSLWKAGAIGLLPAVTARLEVDYCKKVPQNTSVLCTSRLESVEGRKLWMVAEVKDKPNGTTYATARALFVTPRVSSIVSDWIKGLGG
ncbi:hypothetical protein BSKO_08383 [Bryopsis sp. KO-2023]|nr:hypothetical protein BSKO_08383 [Bryopsis sp. KO-2023]